MKRAAAAFLSVVLTATAALAGGPAAIVEDIDAPNATVSMMDYVESGQAIALGGNGTLVLGYLRSCLRETITGGTVTVGAEKSTVAGGKVVRERVECDGGKLQLTLEQAGKSAVVAFRKSAGGMAVTPSYKIYGTSPVIRTGRDVREIVIERLDRPGGTLTFKVERGYVDLAAAGKALKPRGLYRVRADGRQVVFKVDAYARPGAGPLIGRLVGF